MKSENVLSGPCTSAITIDLQEKLKRECQTSYFFTERIVNVWNSLPNEIDFSTVKSFTRTIKRVSTV